MTIRDIAIAFGYEIDKASEKKANDSINTLKTTANKFLGAIGIGISLGNLNAIAEEFNGINDKIKNATDGMGEQSDIQQRILKAANDTKQSYAAMADSVSKLAQNKGVFSGVEDAAHFSELVAKNFVAAGKSEGEVASLMNTINTSMSRGEANSRLMLQMFRDAPETVNMLAKTFGVSTAKLEEMAGKGQITAKMLKEAFVKNADIINAKFDGLDYSISDALLNIRNQWGLFVDGFNSSLGITQKIAKFMVKGFTEFINVLKRAQTWVERFAKKIGGVNNLLKLVAAVAGGIFLALNAGKILGFLQGVTKLLNPMSLKIALIAAAFALLFLIIDDFINFMKGNDSLFGELLTKAGVDADTLRDKIISVWTKISAFMKSHGSIIKGVLKGLSAAFLLMRSGIFKLFAKIPFSPWVIAIGALIAVFALLFKNKDKLGEFVNGIKDKIKEFASKGIELIQSLVETVIENLPILVDAGISILTSIVDGIIEAVPKILPAIISFINTLVSGIVKYLPVIITTGIKILTSIINGIVKTLPVLVKTIVDLINSIIGAVAKYLPVIIKAGVQILLALIDGLTTVLPLLIDAAITLIISILNAIIDSLPLIIDAGIQILLALISGIVEILPQLIQAAIGILIALFDAIIENIDTIIDAGIKIITALIEGLIAAIPQIVESIPKILVAIIEGFAQIFPKVLDLGKEIIKKLWDGILSMGGWIGEKVGGLISGALGGIGEFFGGIFGGGKNDDKPKKGGGGKTPAYAKGTNNAANTAIVGEDGPELVTGIKGAKVFTSDKTKEIVDVVGKFANMGVPKTNRTNMERVVQTSQSSVTNRVITINQNIDNTFQGDRAGQEKSSVAMDRAANDSIGELARALLY